MPPKKKKSELPEDLEDLLGIETQADLHSDEDVAAQTIVNTKEERLNQAYRMVASTREGAHVLRHIMALTGYKAPLITYNRETFELNPYASIYNTSKRDVWLEIQRRLPAMLLREIEVPLEVQ